MQTGDIPSLAKEALAAYGLGPVWTLLILALSAWFGSAFGSFLRKKGENLATLEDIERITEKSEKVKAQYAEKLERVLHENRIALERLSQTAQYSLAAVERRLEANQQAYTLWYDLFHSLHDPDLDNHVYACQQWWKENCIYLSDEVKQAFQDACRRADNHRNLQETGNTEAINANFEKIYQAGEILQADAELPSMGRFMEITEIGKQESRFTLQEPNQ